MEIKKKEKLWVVSELYYPEETSTGYYLTKIAEGLVQDFEVGVICGQPNYSAKKITAPAFEKHKKVDIYRVFGTRFDKNKIPLRLLNMFTLSFSVFFKCLFKFKKNETVLVVTTPPLLPFITGICAKIKRAKHIPLIHDNYPEILIAVNKTKKDSLFSKLLNYFNRKLYRNAHRIIVVGRDMKELVAEKMSHSERGKICVIQNWAELETVSPAPRETNQLLKQLGLKDELVLLYAGNMGYPNDIESFLLVAEKLLGEDLFHFIFLGAGVKLKYLQNTVEKKKLKNVTILEPRPRSEQNMFLNACDVGIVSLTEKMRGVSMPSRTYNIMGAGKPILALCEPDSEIELVIKENKNGWAVIPDNPELLKKTIEAIATQKYNLAEMGRRSRKAAVETYSLEAAIEKYKKVLNPNASDNE